MSEDIWSNPGEFTADVLQYFVGVFAKARWVTGMNVVAPKGSELTLTALGEQRLRELYQIQRILFPNFFGMIRSEHDGPARAGAQAAFDAILVELDATDFTVQQKEFLMAFVRYAFKTLWPSEIPPQNPPRPR